MTGGEAQLRAAGMSAAQSAAKAAALETLGRELRRMRGGGFEPHFALFVPGRLEFLGKHTDYAGGRSIVCAIERGICLVAAPRDDAQIRIRDAGRGSSVSFAFQALTEPAAGHWSNFPMTVASRLARDFPGMHLGADMVFSSDLPRASGMSSSSALVVAIFYVLAHLNSLAATDAGRALRAPEDLAGYIAAIESGAGFASFSGSRGVGTHGGSEDHVAIICSRAGFLRQYSFSPIRLQRELRFPGELALVIGASGVKADKTGDARAAYNRASGAARRILELWRSATGAESPSLAAVLAADPDALGRLRQLLANSHDCEYPPALLLNRLAQLHEESGEIVPRAGDALERGDFVRLGALVDRSQFLAESCLENQVPETVALARAARQLGALAASAFGAGFGGSVWALTESARAEEFHQAWSQQYHLAFPARAEASCFFIARPGPGVIPFV